MPQAARSLFPQPARDAHRPNATDRGYDRRWRNARLLFLRKHPLCIHCQREGQMAAATVVDHIIPHRGDQTKFWDQANWQPLCARHHNLKTAHGS